MDAQRPKVAGTATVLVVSDLKQSLDFYCDKLGFRDPATWGSPPCFGTAHRDGFDIMLSLTVAPGNVHPNGPSGVWDLYIKVLDLPAEQEALEALAVKIAKGPAKTEYGMLELEIVDPDGYRLCIAQELP